MEHSQIKNYTQLFLEGKLSVAEESELLAWIKQSPENRDVFLKYQQSFGEGLKNKPNRETTEVWEKLQLLLPATTVTPVRFIRNWYQAAAAIAAAFVIGFVVSLLVTRGLSVHPFQPVVQQKIIAPFGARTNFVLPDSSIVWLNSGSELEFPSQFGKNRPVSLSGEAYFEVEKGKKPFIVSTIYGAVEVKGTSFNVKAWKNEGLETTLVSGSVNVFAQNGKGITLHPGHQAILTQKGFEVAEVETGLYTSWKDGKLIFRKEYLPEIAKRLERWYNVKIELDNDPRLKEIHYTGTLEMESFSEVLNLLGKTAPVDYTWDEKNRIIKIFYQKNNG
jgi:ferric-dicitrate binding protein FerR (iron transport regulator)